MLNLAKRDFSLVRIDGRARFFSICRHSAS